MSLGPLLTRTRRARGVPQADLAQRLGAAVSTVSKWERDLTVPDATSLRDICRILHVSADVLLERVPFQLGPMPEKAEP